MKNFKAFLIRRKLLLILFTIGLLLSAILFSFPLFSQKPKIFSTVTFNSKVTQKISANDTLTGRGIPNSSVNIYLLGEETKVKTNEKGEWSFQIPKNSTAGKYILTTLILDKLDNISSIKTYRLQVVERKSYIPKIPNLFQPKKASAQGAYYDFERLLGPNWVYWLSLNYSQDIYPAYEGGDDLVFYNKQTYSERYCGGGTCPFVTRPITDWTKEFDEDVIFFAEVVNAAMLQCYTIASLEPYFPDINTRLDTRLNRFRIGIPCINGHKDSIDKETLEGLIQRVAIETGFNEKDVFKGVVLALDPFVGSRSLYNVVTGYGLTNTEDRINAFFAVLSLVPYARTGSQLLGKGIHYGLDLTGDLRDVSMFRAAIKEGQAIPLSAVAKRAASVLETIPASDFTEALFNGINIVKNYSLIPKSLYKATSDELSFLTGMRAVITEGNGYVIQENVTRTVFDNLMAGMKRLESRGLIKIDPAKVAATIDDRWIFMVDKDTYINEFPTLAASQGFTVGRLTILKDFWETWNEIADTLTHEFIHIINGHYPKFGKPGEGSIGKYFSYGQDQASRYGAIMSQIYELSTDLLAKAVSDYRFAGGYQYQYPELSNSIETLINTVMNRSRGALTEIDFMNFALTADDDTLMRKILSNMDIEEFLSIIDDTIEVDVLNQIMKDYQASSFKKIAAIGGGLTPILLYNFFTSNASGEELPSDATIYYLPPDFSDVNLLKTPVNYGINIISLEGKPLPGSSLKTSAIIYLNGIAVYSEGLYKSWALKKADDNTEVKNLGEASLLEGGEKCTDDCKVSLPANLLPGEYKLIVYLTKGDNKFILAQSVLPLIIEEPKGPEITFITIADQTIAADNLEQDANFFLPGTEEEDGSFDIPVTVSFSNREPSYLAVIFNYVIPKPCPQSYPQCGGGPGLEDKDPTHAYRITPKCNDFGVVIGYEEPADQGESAECLGEEENPQEPAITDPGEPADSIETPAEPVEVSEPPVEELPQDNQPPPEEVTEPQNPAECPSAYGQCGRTTGLDDYPASDTVWVTPVCNEAGSVIDYSKDNQGNQGQCCEDKYYFDESYDTCVHKYSNDGYPNCYYQFDPVEMSFCP